MSAHRFIGIAALLMVAACAGRTASVSGGATPRATPRAAVHATYSGGILNRQASAVFRVDESAYVMVAHLGGDGRIQVLFPEDARETGRVPGGKWFRTPTFSAYYDVAPQMYSFANTRYRGVGAQIDSYDGVGNGFVFMIASKWPLRFDRVSDFGLWDDFEAENYRNTMDPRESVRAFAEMVSGGREFTLQFARSTSTTALTSSIDQMFDCAYFTTIGFSALGSPWYYGLGYLGLSSPLNYLSRCGNRYASAQVFGSRFAYWPTAGDGTARPTSGIPRFDRPGFHPRGQTGPSLGFNRPTHRTPTVGATESSFAPRERGRSFGPRAASTGMRDAFGVRGDFGRRGDFGSPDGGRTYAAPRSMPNEMPRANPAPSVDRGQAQPSPRAEPVREHAQPTARPSPEEKKP